MEVRAARDSAQFSHSGSTAIGPSQFAQFLRDHADMRWSDQPGYKAQVPRHFLEALAEQMAEPEQWVRSRNRLRIRDQPAGSPD